MKSAVITGWGKCLPPAKLSNHDLATFLDTSDEWITSRTGVSSRRITHVDISDLAHVAGQRALDAAGLDASQIDGIILATASGDSLIPNTAARVQQKLGVTGCAAIDINAACTGFIYALTQASAQIKVGLNKRMLIIGADRLSWYADWTIRESAVLFGDGAGAVVLEASDDHDQGFVSSKLGCDSDGLNILGVNDIGTGFERFPDQPGIFNIDFEGQEIYMRAIEGMKQASEEVLSLSGWEVSDIDSLVPHQANKRIITSLAKQLKISEEKVFLNVERYGNMSAATVPVAITEAVEQKKIVAGSKVLTAAFGAGLTWGAASFIWGKRTKPIKESFIELPECQLTALELIKPKIEECFKAHGLKMPKL